MAESAVVTVRLEKVTAERLGALALSTRRSRSWLAAEAITAYVERNAWQVAEVEAGLAELDAGRGVGEAEAEALFDQLER